MNLEVIPSAPCNRGQWISGKLLSSTKRLNKAGVHQEVRPELDALIQNLSRGNDMEHLKNLLNKAGFRGSDVRLLTNPDLGRGEQTANSLSSAGLGMEVCTKLQVARITAHQCARIHCISHFFRKACCESSFHHFRAFHIFDSRVCSCVIAMGRSSSKVLNRPLRRYCALALASDSYILPLWIISSWNFSDSGSRICPLDSG